MQGCLGLFEEVKALGGIEVKRIYDGAAPEDGLRILVDRLWPRGMKKEAAQLSRWAKEVAPRTATRKAFAHDARKMEAFRAVYRKELSENEAAWAFVAFVEQALSTGNVTLLYAAKSTEVNHATVLKEWLEEQMEEGN